MRAAAKELTLNKGCKQGEIRGGTLMWDKRANGGTFSSWHESYGDLESRMRVQRALLEKMVRC